VGLALQRAGHTVMGLARSDASAEKLLDRRMLVRRGDLTKTDVLIQAAEESQAIIWAAADAQAAEHDPVAVAAMLDKFAGTGKSFIYTAGVWDFGNTHGKPVDEKSPFNPAALVSWRPAVTQMVLDAASRDIQTAVILPSFVYGYGAGIPAMLVKSAKEEGAARLVGDGENHWCFVHADDLANLYVRALQAPPGTMLIGSAGQPYKAREIAEAASRSVGADNRVTLWPVDEARSTLGPFADALVLDTNIKTDRARKLLGWQPIGPSIIDDLESGSYTENR
jgi:nucleoside-diphosphate-sugar epimerase